LPRQLLPRQPAEHIDKQHDDVRDDECHYRDYNRDYNRDRYDSYHGRHDDDADPDDGDDDDELSLFGFLDLLGRLDRGHEHLQLSVRRQLG
jgi:hypothetical protein